MSAQHGQTPDAFLTDWLHTHLGEAARSQRDVPRSAKELAEACRADAEKSGIPPRDLAAAVNKRDAGGSGLAPLISVTMEDETDTPALTTLGEGA